MQDEPRVWAVVPAREERVVCGRMGASVLLGLGGGHISICDVIWSILVCSEYFFLKKKIFLIYFLEKGEGREKERETLLGCLLQAPNQGPAPQPRHGPQPGIELVTFQFVGCCPTH